MPETTETLCHWEQVQRRWRWEWASYRPHAATFWTADTGSGVTDVVEDATLAAEPPGLALDAAYGSRWEKVSGTGTNVVVGEVDLPEGEVPAGDGWRMAELARP